MQSRVSQSTLLSVFSDLQDSDEPVRKFIIVLPLFYVGSIPLQSVLFFFFFFFVSGSRAKMRTGGGAQRTGVLEEEV